MVLMSAIVCADVNKCCNCVYILDLWSLKTDILFMLVICYQTEPAELSFWSLLERSSIMMTASATYKRSFELGQSSRIILVLGSFRPDPYVVYMWLECSYVRHWIVNVDLTCNFRVELPNSAWISRPVSQNTAPSPNIGLSAIYSCRYRLMFSNS